MEKRIQLNELDPDGLKTIIRGVLKEELEKIIYLLKRKEPDKYLSRKEAADFLKISETTLWSLDKTQVLPARRLNGKVLYLKSDLLNFDKLTA